MRLLICGSRKWLSLKIIEEALDPYPRDTQIIHGDCRGADKMAEAVALKLGFLKPIAYPAAWKTKGPAAGPIRNRQMLKEGNPDKVLAFHKELCPTRGGTADMIRVAKAAKVEVEVITGPCLP